MMLDGYVLIADSELAAGIAAAFIIATVAVVFVSAIVIVTTSVLVARRHRQATGVSGWKRALVGGLVAGVVSGALGWLLIVRLAHLANTWPGVLRFWAPLLGYVLLVVLGAWLGSRAAVQPTRSHVVPLILVVVVLIVAQSSARFSQAVYYRTPSPAERHEKLRQGDAWALRYFDQTGAQTLSVAIASLDQFSDADRPEALKSIGRHPAADAQAAEALASYLDGGRQRTTAADVPAALIGLRHMGPKALPGLDALKHVAQNHSEKAMRVDALATLAGMKGHEAEVLPVMMDALQDPDGYVRERAIHYLGELGPHAAPAIDELEALAGREHHAVEEALKKIRSQPVGSGTTGQ